MAARRRQVHDPRERGRGIAVRLLARCARSTAEVRRRLEREGLEDAVVGHVIAELDRLGYLNDEAYARSRARWLVASLKLGPRAIEARLRAKGVEADLAREAVRGALAEAPEDAVARTALRGRRFGPGASDAENARAVRFLLGRGFTGPTVARVLGLAEDVDIGAE